MSENTSFKYAPTLRCNGKIAPAVDVEITSLHVKPEYDASISYRGGSLGTAIPEPWNGWFGYYCQDVDADLDFSLFFEGKEFPLRIGSSDCKDIQYKQYWGTSYGGYFVLMYAKCRLCDVEVDLLTGFCTQGCKRV